MDRIDALEERVAELEQRLADVVQRQAEDSAAWYKHRQSRLEVRRSPSTAALKLVPRAHGEVGDAGSSDVWVEQMKLRLALLIKKIR